MAANDVEMSRDATRNLWGDGDKEAGSNVAATITRALGGMGRDAFPMLLDTTLAQDKSQCAGK